MYTYRYYELARSSQSHTITRTHPTQIMSHESGIVIMSLAKDPWVAHALDDDGIPEGLAYMVGLGFIK